MFKKPNAWVFVCCRCGFFHFKLSWPDLGPDASNIWKQQSNPIQRPVGSNPQGYQANDGEIFESGWSWNGLAKSDRNAPSLLDGSMGKAYFYSVGTQKAWKGGIPGPGCRGSSTTCKAVQQVELWVKKPSGDPNGMCSWEFSPNAIQAKIEANQNQGPATAGATIGMLVVAALAVLLLAGFAAKRYIKKPPKPFTEMPSRAQEMSATEFGKWRWKKLSRNDVWCWER